MELDERRDEPEAIFVVGVSRSGTTLVRKLLERSPRIAIAPENHYLSHRRARGGARAYFRGLGDPRDDGVVRRIVDEIYSGEFQQRTDWGRTSPFWRWLTRRVERSELERRLLTGERSERGLWVQLLRTYADTRGGDIMGEKTPAHLEQVATMVDWFPDCRVVHIIRDPRAVYVSHIQDARNHGSRGGRRQQLQRLVLWLPSALSIVSLVQTAVGWRRAARLHAAYASRYARNYTLVRFEDVVRRPDETLPALFEFLGVELPPDPTAVMVVSHGAREGEEGLDVGAADRWRQQIGPLATWLLGLALREPMKRLGYTA